MQAYSNPKRASDPYALPDIEVFFVSDTEAKMSYDTETKEQLTPMGWYWWYCMPGCLPDSDPIGPFETEEQALADAQSESWQYNDE
jgi:hypothetical protein